jgi:AraC-like DNA-binding protein
MLTPKTKNRCQPDLFPIAVERRQPHEQLSPNGRNFSEIVIILSGRAWHVSEGVSRPLTVGDVLVFGPHDSRDYRETRELHLIRILFWPEKLRMKVLDLSGLTGYQALFTFESQTITPQNRALHLSPKEQSVVLNYAETLAHELEMRSPGFAFMAYAWFMQLVGYLCRVYSRLDPPDRQARSNVGNAIDHLHAHFDQPVNLEELSRLTHMSRRSFFRAFQAATGNTPIAYLTNLRLACAAAMLKRREENVTSVALKVGYNDSNYFARRFHAMFGVPPSKYRRRQELL